MYELWKRNSWGSSFGLPIDKFGAVDSGIYDAVQLSKKDPDTVYMIVEKGIPSRIRGFAKAGKWLYAVDCKRCKGNCWDTDDCMACKGAGWKFES